jgi:hypothetical protein
MPNWVHNNLQITGPKEDIAAVKAQLNKPFEMLHENWNTETGQYEKVNTVYDNPVFSFYNIIAPTDLETYHLQKDPKAEGMFDGDNWYNWNLRNWGTKWDVAVHNDEKYSDTDLQDEDEYSLCYRFNTAWGIPEEAIMNLTEQYPRLMLDLEFEEETGWGGRTTYQMNDFGVLRTIESEWNWKCMECDYCELNDPSDNFCEDCEEIVCPECNSNNWLNDKCQTHGVQSDPTTTTEEE